MGRINDRRSRNQFRRQDRIDLLERLLMEYHPSGKAILSKNVTSYLMVLNQLGEAYRDLGNFGKAKEYLEEALNLIQNDDHSSLKASIYNNLGNAYYSYKN